MDVETPDLPASRLQGPPVLCCPRDVGHPLQPTAGGLQCSRCGLTFPIVAGVPILLDEVRSVFNIADYSARSFYQEANETGQKIASRRGFRRAYLRITERLQWSHLPGRHMDAGDAIAEMLRRQPGARILVIGAGLRRYPGETITYTDVAISSGVTCVCDAHDLPFEDGAFDGVVAAAVLEHVMDPVRCVAEMQRILSPNGYAYAITPFMQPVHMGAHDFTRWTHLGHRRLFRWFDDIESGICGGPGSAFALSLRALLMSMSSRSQLRPYLRLAGLILSYPLLQLDRWATRGNAGYDGACAVYFFGAKRPAPCTDRQILAMFRGG